MLRMFSRALFFAVVCLFVAGASAYPIDDGQDPNTSDAFSLYAYGDGISGLPVFYADGICLPFRVLSEWPSVGIHTDSTVSQAKLKSAIPNSPLQK
jgi:hypothetical protein